MAMAEYKAVEEKVMSKQRPVAVLLGMGLKPKDVSELTGYSERAIYNCMIRPQFKELVGKYAERYAGIQLERGADAITALQERMKDAVDVLVEIMSGSEDDNARARAAINILHMGGLKPVDKKQTTGVVHLVISTEGIGMKFAEDVNDKDRGLLGEHEDGEEIDFEEEEIPG